MESLGPIVIILAVYLLFVLKIGPAFMRKREAYKLTNILLAYNAVQVAISLYLVIRVSFSNKHNSFSWSWSVRVNG
ncbi:hypothetical protein O3G_MSEX000540 [Manduca sexta]|nr:hypothetical protein O3G_MSEX000540 [Manduca sexta]